MNPSQQPAGALAIQLIQQLKRNPDLIPPFLSELMKACTNNINELYELNHADLLSLKSGNVEDKSQMTVLIQTRQCTLKFVRRCCMAYVHERMERIKALRWKFGQIPQAVKPNLSECELELFNDYCNTLAEYQTSCSNEEPVDITENMQPPKNLFAQVRVVDDYGEFETSRGDSVILRKNTIHSLPAKDCEPLVRQGVLEYCY